MSSHLIKADLFGDNLQGVISGPNNKSSKRVWAAAGFLTAYLSIAEIGEWLLSPNVVHEVGVDSSLNALHNIVINVTFTNYSCDEFKLDTSDVFGNLHLDVKEGVTLVRLLNNGTQTTDPIDPDQCLPCHEAADPAAEAPQCCNTCKDLRHALHESGLDMKLALQHTQCQEGCRLETAIEVGTCNGSIRHIPGSARADVDAAAIYTFDVASLRNYGFDMSHIINDIRFEDIPGDVDREGLENKTSQHANTGANPAILEGVHLPLRGKEIKHTDRQVNQMIYEVVFVPTDIWEDGQLFKTHQYQALFSDQVVLLNGHLLAAPGWMLNYRFLPFRITHRESHQTLGELLLPLVTIIGGVVALADLTVKILDKIQDELAQ